MSLTLVQVWVVPWIEEDQDALKLYKVNEGAFWMKLLDPNDDWSKTIMLLIIDGAHRHWVCGVKKIKTMRAVFVRPSISMDEAVRSYIPLLFVCSSAAVSFRLDRITRCVIADFSCQQDRHVSCFHVYFIICVQAALGHTLNRTTTHGHVRQTDCDDMFSYNQLMDNRKCTQVDAQIHPNLVCVKIAAYT